MLCTLFQKEEAIAIALSHFFSPNHSFPGLVVCAHSSIEVSKEDEFVCPGCSRNHRIQIIIELVFDLIWVGHCGCIGTIAACLLADNRSLSVIRLSFMPFGSPESLLTRCDLMAKPTLASRRSFFLRPLQKKV